MKPDYKLIANQYQAENFLLLTENQRLLSPIEDSFQVSLLISNMIGETLLFASKKGYTDKIVERLDRLQKISEFVLQFDNVCFDLNRYRQHLKVAAYQRQLMKEENELLKKKLEQYEKWER